MVSLIDRNFGQHAFDVIEATKRMKVFATKNLTYSDCGLSCDTFNIMHIHKGQSLSKQELHTAIQHYVSEKRDYCIWINRENLTSEVEGFFRQLGMKKQGEEIGMVLNLSDYKPVESSDHYENIKVVKNPALLSEYAEVIASNWNPKDQNVLKFYKKAFRFYLNKEHGVTMLVYFQKGMPISTVELFPTDDETVGLYGLATLAQNRGKGIGTAMMNFALKTAKEMGYKNAILQASEDGIGIYHKLGFENITTYFEFAGN